MMAAYGYARVSTSGQELDIQLAQLTGAGCLKIFWEKWTGTDADRPQLNRLLKKLKPTDTVIVTAVDRLARDPTDLLVLAREMQRAGAGLRSLAEPIVDTTSDFSDLVLAALGIAAKLERRRIMDRTARGRAAAREKGVRFGRPPKLSGSAAEQVLARCSAGEGPSGIAGDFRVSRWTILRLRRKQLISQAPTQGLRANEC